MRKSIKLLAVVLSVILLVATLATVISAIPAYVAPTGLTNLYKADCETALPGGFNATNGFTMSNVSFNENGVAHITNAPNGTMVTHTSRQIGTLCNPYKFIGDSEFTTFDFDVTSDKYTDGTRIITAAEYASLSAAEKANCTPAYTYTRFYLEIPRLDTYGSECSLYIKQIDGVWSLCNYAGSAVPLSTTAGVWSHITYVIDVDADVSYVEGGVKNTLSYAEYTKVDKSKHSDATVTYSCAIHIYVDGEYGFQLGGGVNNASCPYDRYVYDGNTGTSKNGATFKYIQFQAGLWSSSRVTNPTSMMFDNVTLNKYPEGYNGDLANALKTYGSIKNCNDTIFNVNYPYPAGTADAAAIINPDGSQESYYLYEAALNAVSEGCILSLNADATIPFKPEFPFYIQTNGYKFELAYDSTYLTEDIGDGLLQLREAAPEDYGTVIFDEGGTLEATISVINGITPQYPAELGVIKIGASMKMVDGWSTVKGAFAAEKIPAAVAGETIKLYPVYTNLAFAVMDADGKIVKGYANKLDFINATKSIAPGCTIVLYTDIDLNEFGLAPGATPFAVTGELTIDLNGHRLSRVFDDPTSGKPTMFNLSASAKKLEIYSSVPGGEIISIVKMPSSIGGGPLIQNNSSGKIIFGNGSDNLHISCAMLLQNNTGTPAVTMDGGSYFVVYKQSDGLLHTRGGTINLDAKNATIGTYSDAVSIFAAKKNAGFNANIDNCLVIGGRFMYVDGGASALASEFHITNTDIILTTSNVWNTEGIVVYLGDNVRYNRSYVNFTVEDNCTAIESNDKVEVSYFWYRPINFITVDGNVIPDPECMAAPTEVKATYTMITTVYSNSKFGKIEWCDPNGNVVGETLGFPGTTAVFDGDTSVFYGEQVTGYTAKSFSGWKNLAGTDDLTVLGGVTNRFTAVCEGDPVPFVRPSHNIATSTSFVLYFYLPVDDTVTINYINVNGENVLGTNRISIVKIGGKSYYRVSTTPGAYEAEAYNHAVSYTVDGKTKVQSFDISLESYFTSVLSSDAYSLVEKQLIATALNYCNQIYNYINGETYYAYDELLKTYSGYVTTVTNTQIRADAELDMSLVKDTVKGALFSIGNGYRPMFGFIVADGVESVTFTNVTNKDGSTITYTVRAGYGHADGVLASGANIPVYDIRETITVVVGENTGTFNLAAYIVYLQSQPMTAENLNAINLCKALYAYSAASLAYKLA